jgi:hypothetical protein
MGWQDVTPSDEIEAAEWIPERLHGFAKNVGSIVPNGFEAYARIFHPAWKYDGQNETTVRWSEIAAANETFVHPEMQFHAIARTVLNAPPPPDRRYREPRLGVLPASQGEVLAEILAAHTTTPGVSWFCLWEGYGYLHPGGTQWLVSAPRSMRWRRLRLWWLRRSLRRRQRYPRAGPRVQLPGRAYLLFKGSVVRARGWEDGPNLWWPEDRAWCVASEIDFPYTYVGGSKALIDDILRHPDLESMPATVEDGVNASSDKINS